MFACQPFKNTCKFTFESKYADLDRQTENNSSLCTPRVCTRTHVELQTRAPVVSQLNYSRVLGVIPGHQAERLEPTSGFLLGWAASVLDL